MNTRVTLNNGKIQNREDFKRFLKALNSGTFILHSIPCSRPKSIDEWRGYYFSLRDILYHEGESGETKDDLHLLAKKYIMPLLMVDSNNFNVPITELGNHSTKYLTELGWENYVKTFQQFAQMNYNCYL